jgi:COMPASS component SPP1
VTKRTTWKQRCLNGLSDDMPTAVAACHKPIRGDGSKFCSDTCGMTYMRKRIDKWAGSGGNRAHLWESVKGAPRREGTVAVVPVAAAQAAHAMPSPSGPHQVLGDHRASLLAQVVRQPAQNRIEREVARLRTQLADWAARRAVLEHALGTVEWRTRLLARASSRADALGACGWDQRLCYGDEECEEFGAGVLESYDGGAEGDEAQMDEYGAWWCSDSRKCARHSGCVSSSDAPPASC